MTQIFYCLRDYHRGTLPKYFFEDPELMQWIRELAKQIPISESTKFEDVSASVSSEHANEYWKKRNKAANFLKHANHDDNKLLNLDEIDNLELLMQACSAYVDLSNDDLGPEMLVLGVYYCTLHNVDEAIPTNLRKMSADLKGLEQSERLSICYRCVRELTASSR